ncbi:hypothetical protein LEP1GSC016_0513 [Leptospira borgpetersenii serovar Hardjo-bovis str. Sponselee]|uniref:Uncharacterized protein n=2 Tax=Leptospira borgpetersenii TaxID=174 RepID=M6BX58_LEPBO|nr:hypothetical protein LBK6_00450 [Leptospira borgpetersenii serovar Hardjo]AWV68848.1 hypothetical protein B9T54_00510 [Leptospira borgpetersenii serovar Hardjo-bovis]EMJ84139.1 hypothetical protein LEP1GSC016_0513 [Leptospira borgpetersenii serovar Hardjo-bovis str. Sponselee]EMO63629.1 hypothetical protein LEP1GSC133_1421 [Leptospira borgpetersenii serovar Pomona str. 200901868]TQE51829.1 hypothetical protein FFZ95_12770 [Leptospira borgpetersenii]
MVKKAENFFNFPIKMDNKSNKLIHIMLVKRKYDYFKKFYNFDSLQSKNIFVVNGIGFCKTLSTDLN